MPDKDEVFKEIFRVLKVGGHFCISDIVLIGELPEGLRKNAEMYAGCVSGAIQKEAYLELIEENGFSNVTIQKEKPINIPSDILKNYLREKELNDFKTGNTGILALQCMQKNKNPAVVRIVATKRYRKAILIIISFIAWRFIVGFDAKFCIINI